MTSRQLLNTVEITCCHYKSQTDGTGGARTLTLLNYMNNYAVTTVLGLVNVACISAAYINS